MNFLLYISRYFQTKNGGFTLLGHCPPSPQKTTKPESSHISAFSVNGTQVVFQAPNFCY